MWRTTRYSATEGRKCVLITRLQPESETFCRVKTARRKSSRVVGFHLYDVFRVATEQMGGHWGWGEGGGEPRLGRYGVSFAGNVLELDGGVAAQHCDC